MQKIVVYILKISKVFRHEIIKPFDYIISYLIFYANGVQFSSFKNIGYPKMNVGLGGQCQIGENFRSNNREMSNPIGRFNRCSIIVGKKGELIIGKNVGISSTAIVCQEYIYIGNNVKIGGNVVIYDTDFHSLEASDRLIRSVDERNTRTKPVIIGNDVFIGAHSTILKGVIIGDKAIIGACSVVTKSVPPREVWAGNPAKLVR